MDRSVKIVSFNCKGVKTSVGCIRRLCVSADIIALQETWLMPHDLGFLGSIHDDFAYTGTSAIDTSAGLLQGRPYGGVALLWRKSLFTSGAAISLVSGLALTMWFSFGEPRPELVKLHLSIENCAANITIPEVLPVDPSEYFYPYRISYMWTSPIGFVWVMVLGSVISLLWRQEHPWERSGLPHPDPNLFTPPLARRLRARFEETKPVKK